MVRPFAGMTRIRFEGSPRRHARPDEGFSALSAPYPELPSERR